LVIDVAKFLACFIKDGIFFFLPDWLTCSGFFVFFVPDAPDDTTKPQFSHLQD